MRTKHVEPLSQNAFLAILLLLLAGSSVVFGQSNDSLWHANVIYLQLDETYGEVLGSLP